MNERFLVKFKLNGTQFQDIIAFSSFNYITNWFWNSWICLSLLHLYNLCWKFCWVDSDSIPLIPGGWNQYRESASKVDSDIRIDEEASRTNLGIENPPRSRKLGIECGIENPNWSRYRASKQRVAGVLVHDFERIGEGGSRTYVYFFNYFGSPRLHVICFVYFRIQ